MNGVISENNLVSDAYLLDYILLKEEPQREIWILSSIRKFGVANRMAKL